MRAGQGARYGRESADGSNEGTDNSIVAARAKPICADGSVPQCDATCADGTNPPCAKVIVARPCGRNRHYSISMWALMPRCDATCADGTNPPCAKVTVAPPCGRNRHYTVHKLNDCLRPMECIPETQFIMRSKIHLAVLLHLRCKCEREEDFSQYEKILI